MVSPILSGIISRGMPISVFPVRSNGREIGPHKAVICPLLRASNVLTNTPWTFVTLWLQRAGNDDARFYWEQAYQFYNVSLGLPPQSAPLLLYYSFMNAAKALLSAKRITFNEYHGVRAYRRGGSPNRFSIATDGIHMQTQGVLPSLAAYYGEAETSRAHTLQELFFNMVFIHRTYCLTYTTQREMYVPLANCGYVVDRASKRVVFRADIGENVPLRYAISRLPESFISDRTLGDRAIRSTAYLTWPRPNSPTAMEFEELVNLNRTLRRELHYINGIYALWYIRTRIAGPRRLNRQLPTMILGAMHRLSEICRYRPLLLASLLASQKNWLISEFIQMSASQFIDEIASEMTGYQFFIPNVRPAK
jgi:hypothetical protein